MPQPPFLDSLFDVTSRITISPGTNSEEHICLFGQGTSSIIAKYAPPYVADIGERAPFSQLRQVIEAQALDLLSQPSTHAYMHSNLFPNVATPLLLHDPSAHVLLMSDLGRDSLTLDRWLVSVCPSVEAAKALGTRFGLFFARLGGLKDAIADLQLDFTIPGAREFLREIVVQAVRYNLLTCGIDPTEADALAELAMGMFVRQGEADDKVFSMGDCQPKSLLVLAEDGLAVTD